MRQGEKNGNCRLTKEQVETIYRIGVQRSQLQLLIDNAYDPGLIAESFNISASTVKAIWSGRSWRHVTDNLPKILKLNITWSDI